MRIIRETMKVTAIHLAPHMCIRVDPTFDIQPNLCFQSSHKFLTTIFASYLFNFLP